MHPDRFEELASALLQAFPALDEEARTVSRALYRKLSEGRPVAPPTLAMTAGLPLARVEAILDDWAAVYRNEDGAVIGYWGLALPDMGHALQVDGVQLYAWCAWDTLFLPELIGKPAEVVSTTPGGETVRLSVATDGQVQADREGLVVSIVVPHGGLEGDVISSFCHYVYFFEDRAAAEAWAKGRENIELLTLEQAVELGRRKNHAMYVAPPSAARPSATTGCAEACVPAR